MLFKTIVLHGLVKLDYLRFSWLSFPGTAATEWVLMTVTCSSDICNTILCAIGLPAVA